MLSGFSLWGARCHCEFWHIEWGAYGRNVNRVGHAHENSQGPMFNCTLLIKVTRENSVTFTLIQGQPTAAAAAGLGLTCSLMAYGILVNGDVPTAAALCGSASTTVLIINGHVLTSRGAKRECREHLHCYC